LREVASRSGRKNVVAACRFAEILVAGIYVDDAPPFVASDDVTANVKPL
jgi:hypothetical protein